MNDTHSHNAPAQDLRGLLFVLVGPSGVGKNAIIDRVLARLPYLRRMPTATTRAPRPNEREGHDHFFVSHQRFQEMIADGAFIEYQEVHNGKFYGVLYGILYQALREGAYLLADIDIRGAAAIRAIFPNNLIAIFVLPPNLETLRERLAQRGNMDAAELEERLKRAQEEIPRAAECNYRVVNDQLDRCVDEVVSIITAEIAARTPTK
ncbi:MAG: guanylate kinase [Candidatus Thermofonsia Clade 1 bacterium]|jgi:guanylate kinase|uniref:Guanylate kinase n=1 Tax=Candidatus Thermofonsia Clade 1 bacterium TaxID=2364210 RepID=A0A2M8PD49_9CHLR|nr:MAG: guanylate kinase [Candidatus Thermofonsia Clade 1 bacterium]PJF42179.1 MAG: guanylate kinase [Candidatus Thermofonsia Clade 1 bacterium]RMF48862.1 MAG: guanylate kinase [Chloroflexota bacterium]